MTTILCTACSAHRARSTHPLSSSVPAFRNLVVPALPLSRSDRSPLRPRRRLSQPIVARTSLQRNPLRVRRDRFTVTVPRRDGGCRVHGGGEAVDGKDPAGGGVGVRRTSGVGGRGELVVRERGRDTRGEGEVAVRGEEGGVVCESAGHC